MPSLSEADTIRILVATDNHVGYEERHPIRGDDSWKAFHEIMCLAKERDVDMVLLAGDLFHENKPSRKAMFKVMQSLRMNCYGEKPCELEMLSEGSEQFEGMFDHANFEDLDINVAIPVFSIHGNHDDPSGQGHLAALDILQMSGLLNYYGRTPESDKVKVKPVLLQKGRTKLALYGLSNIRDDRLHRTFKAKGVTFPRPAVQTEDWFNMICVHQNHHAYTETSYLPESYLPTFLDLVIWGHEHECLIEPRLNPETNFKVMQPGSSIATSLTASEAVPKHIAMVSITGREFKSEPIRLKTVRPFIFRDLVLAQNKEAVKIARKEEHKSELTRLLIATVEELIEQAQMEWLEVQKNGNGETDGEESEPPLPLIRLRVETTPPDGGLKFDCENPQRFSNRFMGRVANTNDVIQYHQKKKGASRQDQKAQEVDPDVMSAIQGLDTVKVDKLVREFLAAQSLTILPQNYFGDAVREYVDKDDRHAMETFVRDSLEKQTQHLVDLQIAANGEEGSDEDELASQIEQYRTHIEKAFASGTLKRVKSKARYKPKPDGWDSDLDGEWEDQPGALLRDDGTNRVGDDSDGSVMPPPKTAARGRGRGRGGRGAGTASTRRTAAAPRKPAGRGKKVVEDDDEDEESDVMILDDENEEDEDSQSMFYKDNTRTNGTSGSTQGRKAATTTTRSTRASPAVKRTPTRAAATKAKQATLNFMSSQTSVLDNGKSKTQSSRVENISDDDDDDAFEPASSIRSRR